MSANFDKSFRFIANFKLKLYFIHIICIIYYIRRHCNQKFLNLFFAQKTRLLSKKMISKLFFLFFIRLFLNSKRKSNFSLRNRISVH